MPSLTAARLLRILLSLLAVVTTVLALYQFFGAYLAMRQRAWSFALFYGLFGFGGVVLSRALWTSRKLFEKRA